jgi:hypothetical protein
MDIGHDVIQVFELFATACDQLNDYARSLRNSGRFFDVRTGTGIRNYQSGWRFEKWIEADIHKGGVAQGGFCAVWWLELGPGEPSGLKLEASLSVNPEHSDIDLPSRTAVTLSEFKEALAEIVNELQNAIEINREFIQAVETAG